LDQNIMEFLFNNQNIESHHHQRQQQQQQNQQQQNTEEHQEQIKKEKNVFIQQQSKKIKLINHDERDLMFQVRYHIIFRFFEINLEVLLKNKKKKPNSWLSNSFCKTKYFIHPN
jgi:hemolysin activation/secretion protein